MSLLNRLRSLFNKRQFPEEWPKGTMRIEGNKLMYADPEFNTSGEVKLEDLQFAYFVNNLDRMPLLFLFDHHQHFLSCHYQGFGNCYKQVSARFGFDDDTFFQHVNGNADIKVEIWRKMHPPSFHLLKHEHDDYPEGFEVLAPTPEFIPWDTPIKQVQESPNLVYERTPYDRQEPKFKYPVRIGNVVLDNFYPYFEPGQPQAPVLHFHADCIDSSNSDQSYFTLKKHLSQDFKPDDQHLDYERADQHSFSFEANKMFISLVYTYDSDWQFNRGSTSLSVSNAREYPDMLVDADYEACIEVSTTLEINEAVTTFQEYKKSERVKRRPAALGSGGPIIWLDRKNGKLGVADQTYAQYFELTTIKHLSIQNILPAKGPGGASLNFTFADSNKGGLLLFGDCHVFNPYVEALEKLTGLPVIMHKEFHDC